MALNKLKPVLAVSFAALISAPVTAGFGDLLKKIGDEGKQILEQKQSNGSTDDSSQLDYKTVIAGLKEALDIGSRRAIETIGQQDGYLGNPQIRIPMPEQLEKVSGLLTQFGLGSQVEQFELSMNRAAEQAAPQATEILVTAIKEMSFDDARNILNGPDNAATEYFREKTSDQLTELFRPTVQQSMSEVGVTKYYGDLTKEAAKVPMVGDMASNYNLDDYVTEQALDGLFTMLAAEEKQIRENPAARTTDLLQQVFSI